MNQVHLATGTEVSPNSARRSIPPIGRAKHFANHPNCLRALDYRGQNRAASDKSLERGVKRLVDMFNVMLTGNFWRHLQHIHREEIEALIFEATDYSAHQATLNTVRF